jgi:threonine/homoserine/homoserine lactone efflux protein
MNDFVFIHFFIAFAAAVIGAVPFGLVNLSVIDATIKSGSREAMGVAHGASVVEVLFALSSILAGTTLSPFFEGNPIVKYIVSAVLVISGLFFWFKKNKKNASLKQKKSFGFYKGVLLNIVSIQVLLFWLLAATLLSAKQLLPATFPEVMLFLAGVWLAKMGVLRIYAVMALKVFGRTEIISANINRIIGVVLLSVSVIQFIKI